MIRDLMIDTRIQKIPRQAEAHFDKLCVTTKVKHSMTLILNLDE